MHSTSTGNVIWDNEFNGNSTYGIQLSNADGNAIHLNDLMLNSTANVQSTTSSNIWVTPRQVLYEYDGGMPYTFQSLMGNFYNDHGLSDLDMDGIADGTYDLPNEEPHDSYPFTSEHRYYDFDVRCAFPSATISSIENVVVLGSMTVFPEPAHSGSWPVLTIQGLMTIGGF